MINKKNEKKSLNNKSGSHYSIFMIVNPFQNSFRPTRLTIFNICHIVRQKCGHTKVVLPSFNEWQTFTFMTRRQTYAWKWPCSLIKVLVKDDGIKPVTLKCKNVITLQLLYYIYSFAWTKNMHFPHLNYMSSFSVTCKIILCTILTRRIGIIP